MCVFTSSLSPPLILPMNRAPPRPAAETHIRNTNQVQLDTRTQYVTHVSEAANYVGLHAEPLPSPDICACRAWCGLGCCPSSMSLSDPSSSGMSTSESSSLATEEKSSWDLWQTCLHVCVYVCVCDQPPLLMSLFSSSFNLFCLIFIAISASCKKKIRQIWMK